MGYLTETEVGAEDENRVDVILYDSGTTITNLSLTGSELVTYTEALSGELTPGDWLGLTITTARGISDLMVSVECLVYGI